jgi:hypothetical protein
MAIYVYTTATGVLYSYIPDSVTIAQAQASKQLAPTATLTAAGLTAVDSLPALNGTHAWDAPTHTVVVVAAPPVTRFLSVYAWILRFTPAEIAAIRASSDSVVQYFLFVLPLALNQMVDLNDPGLATFMARLVTLTLLTPARSTVIMT